MRRWNSVWAGHVAKIDDPRAEEMKDHSIKMGRWRRDTVEVCRDTYWWRVVGIVDRSQEPLTHHLFSMEKNSDDGESALCRLMCGTAQRIFAEFEGIFVDDEWARDIYRTAPAIAESLIELQVHLSLHHAAAYHRRIVRPTEERLGRSRFCAVVSPVVLSCVVLLLVFG